MALDVNVSLPKLSSDKRVYDWASRFVRDTEDRLRRIASQVETVRKNSTGPIFGPRTRFNFIEGSNVTITVADDPIDDEIDITIASSGGGGGGTVTSVAGGVGITNSPEPITVAGTVDLDINSLTSETSLASGDLFPFVDVSVGTSPADQRKVTFANMGSQITLSSLTQITSRLHSDLQGITANDHHNQSHVIATTAGLGADHTTSGLTAGQVLRATGATTAAFQSLVAADLPAHDLLGAQHSGTLAASPVRGDLIAANATPAWARLAIGAANRVLRSDGTDPSWSQVALTTDVTGILPIANGGTNASTFTLGSVIFMGSTALTQNNATFFWDNSTSRLGLGMNTPNSIFEADGGTATRASLDISTSIGNAGHYSIKTGTLAISNTNIVAQLSGAILGTGPLTSVARVTINTGNVSSVSAALDPTGLRVENNLGTNLAAAKLDVRKNSAVTPVALALTPTAIFVGDITNSYAELISGSSSDAGWMFSDTVDEAVGGVTYNHTNDLMHLLVANANQVRIGAAGVRVESGVVANAIARLDVRATTPVTPPALVLSPLVAMVGSGVTGSAYLQFITGTSAPAGLVFTDTAAEARGTVLYQHSSDLMEFGAAGATHATLSSTGLRVQSSAAAAQARLDVRNSAYTLPTLNVTTVGVLANSADTYLQVFSGTASTGGVVFGDTAGDNVGGMIYNHNSDFLTLRAGNTNLVRVTSSGVRIEPAVSGSPAEALHVVGNQVLTGTLYGGTANNDDLLLQSTTASTSNRGNIQLIDQVLYHNIGRSITPGAFYPLMIAMNASTLAVNANTGISVLYANGTITWSGTPQTTGATTLFANGMTLRNTSGTSPLTMTTAYSFADNCQIIPQTGNSLLAVSGVGLLCNPTWNSTVTGNITATRYDGCTVRGTLTSGGVLGGTISVDDWVGYRMEDITVTAATGTTLLRQIGLQVDNLTKASSYKSSLRSLGPAVDMRHAGPAMFGIDAGPNTALGRTVEIERTFALTASIGDAFAGALVLDPSYSGAFTLTRHNYISLEDVSVSGSTVTHAPVFHFDANMGTHRSLASPGSVTTPALGNLPTGASGTFSGWMKINMNGTQGYIPVFV